MGQMLLGVAEFAVGFFTTNPQLMAMGVLTVVGGLIAGKPPTQYGPRLNDLKVQASTYGRFLPIVYVTMRIAGNVIWSTPKIETSHSGGKGGGQPKQVTYTYSQSFAVALCEGPISGVRRIWANGKLIYDGRTGAAGGGGAKFPLLVQSIVAMLVPGITFRVYLGSATQSPDALIQSYVGAANCPAYRDTAYVVFENLQLADYGNQMPNLEFEVVAAGSLSRPNPTLVTANPVFNGFIDTRAYRLIWLQQDHISLVYYDPATASVQRTVTTDSLNWMYWVEPGDPLTHTMWACKASSFDIYDIDSSLVVSNVAHTGSISFKTMRWNPYDSSFLAVQGGSVLCFREGSPNTWSYTIFPTLVLGTSWQSIETTPGGLTVLYSDYDKKLVVLNPGYEVIVNYDVVNAAASATWINTSTYDSVRNLVYICTGSGNHMLVVDLNPLVPTASEIALDGTNNVWPLYHKQSDRVVVTGTGAYPNVYVRDPSNLGTSIDSFGGAAGFWPANYLDGRPLEIPLVPDTLVHFGDSSGIDKLQFGKRVSPNQVAVSTIVSDLCVKAGMQTSDLDVTQLTDLCDGYTVTTLGTARAAIEPLQQAYYFDAVESDGKVKFVKRGSLPVVTIPEDDLAAHAAAQMPDQMQTVRAQEMDLPMEVVLDYMDKDADYLTGTQYSRRMTTLSRNSTQLQMAIAIPASKAKQICDVLRAEAWTARTQRAIEVSSKYAYLEPTDVINVVKAGVTHTCRIVNKDESNGVIKLQLADEDPTIYTQNATAASLPAPVASVLPILPTRLQLMDIPLLRDQDDGVGFYLAACGYNAGWGGCQVYKSSDNGASWGLYGGGIINAATIGWANSALGNWSGGNILDESNSVSVTLLNGSLSSLTEINVLNGGNAALLGGELIQFKNAVLTAPNTYTLSGLLRGRRGTEWAMSTHVANDRFVLLTQTTTYLEAAPSSEYGLARLYAGATFGGYLADAVDVSFTNTAVAQKPYSPVLLGGGRDAAGNLTINWTRRTRIGGSWNNGTDVPLGEASESYDVEIWNAGYTVLKRTFSALSSPTAAYTSAQQVTDFGSNQATVYVRIYQNSATVGRGSKLEGSV